MPRYKVSLHYSNGSVSHQLITSSPLKARNWCIRIFQNDDLREVASTLRVTYGKRVLFDAPPSSVPYDDCENFIQWPTSNPRRIIDCQRLTVTLPKAVVDKAKTKGKGNVSKGLLELVIENRPELGECCFTEGVNVKRTEKQP